MRDFSIDKSAERIKIKETRENFDEVLSCYYNKNYRATIVLLYSVVITDVLFKLKNLEEIYDDEKAVNILSFIKSKQLENPKFSQWEDDLIDEVQKQTNLIDLREQGFIQELKKLRHLCAHPVLEQNYNLFTPNKETVTAHLRNMLECVLLKPPFFSRVIFNDFIEDIANIKDMLLGDIALNKYIKNKYIDNFDDLTLSSVFKSLWKISFTIKTEDADFNRKINTRTLITFISLKYDFLLNFIEQENNYFSNIDLENYKLIVNVFNKFPKIFEVLTINTKTLITQMMTNNYKMRFVSFFDSGLNDHIQYLFSGKYVSDYPEEYPLHCISNTNVKYMAKYIKTENGDVKANDFIINIYEYTHSYDKAKLKFGELITPIIEYFTEEQMKKYLNISNSNQNIFGSFGVNFYNAKQAIQVNEYDIDFGDYQNLK